VAAKLVLTLVAYIVMLASVGEVGEQTDQLGGAHGTSTHVAEDHLGHTIGGMVILLVAAILGKYKPRGLTRRGRRVQAGQLRERAPASPAAS
jgi:ethanolamine transporter EutH